jgi:WXXGXW repeat (2 copies)
LGICVPVEGRMPKSGYLFLLLTAIAMGTAACGNTQDPNQAALNSGGGPASDGNLALVSQQDQPVPQQPAPQPGYQNQAPQANYQEPPAPGYDNYPPPPSPQGGYQGDSNYDDYSDQPEYAGQLVYASQPPPPLPQYDQPPCPGDDYIWTPGYWNNANAGYYWVPGAWVLAPYVDALWTPPYWEAYSGRYRWHRGYWGRHIGFYGGINYGFGYTGRGYYGGYWDNGRFAYNRAVTNVNINIVHNVYSRNVSYNTNTRVSFNGPGGVNVRPIPAELAVLRENRTAPVSAQIQHARAAESNRSQFVEVNRGRPQVIAQTQPLTTNYRTPAARPDNFQQVRPVPQSAPQREAFRPGQNTQRQDAQRQAPQPLGNARPEQQRQDVRPEIRQQGRPEPNRPAAVLNQPVPVPDQRGRNEQPRFQNGVPQGRAEAARPVPEARPVPQEIRPAPQPVQRQDLPRPEAPRPDFQRGQGQRQDVPRQDIPRPENARPAPQPQARPEFTRPPVQAPPAAVPQAPPPQAQAPERQRGQFRPEARPAPEAPRAPEVRQAAPQARPAPAPAPPPAPAARPQPQPQPQGRPAPPAERGGDRGGRGKDKERP